MWQVRNASGDEDVERLHHLDDEKSDIYADSSLAPPPCDSVHDLRLFKAAYSSAAEPATKSGNGEVAFEYTISTYVKLALLAVYLALNMTLTLSNKAIFQRLSAPWLLTALHSAFAAAGCNLLMWIRGQKFTHLSGRDSLIVVTFSTLFTVNIAVSNVSLAMVSVPFHQTMRSLGPLFTVMLYWFLYGRHYSVWTQAALVPIVLGVCMLTYGDYEYDAAGFLLTILGVFLASLKTVATNRILTGSRALDPVEVLARMSPLAALQSAMIGLAVGEQADVIRMVEGWDLSRGILSGIVANSMLALLLNICSFNVNKLAGALAQTVSGNVKQCLTVLLAIPMFGVQIGRIDGLGMIASLAGAAWFSCVELRTKAEAN